MLMCWALVNGLVIERFTCTHGDAPNPCQMLLRGNF
jgi:hypothetical protein